MEPSLPQHPFSPAEGFPIEKTSPHAPEGDKNLEEKVGEKALNVIADRAQASDKPSTTDAHIALSADTATTQKITHTADKTLSLETAASIEERTDDLFAQVSASIETSFPFQFADLVAIPMSADEIDIPADKVFQQTVGQQQEEDDPFADTAEDHNKVIAAGTMEAPTSTAELEEFMSFFERTIGIDVKWADECVVDAMQLIKTGLADLNHEAIKQLHDDFVQTGFMPVPPSKASDEWTYLVAKDGPRPLSEQKERITQHMRENNVSSCKITLLDTWAVRELQTMLLQMIVDRKKRESQQKSPEVELETTTSAPRVVQAPRLEVRRDRKTKIVLPIPYLTNRAAIKRERRKEALQRAMEAAREKKQQKLREEKKSEILRRETARSERESARLKEDAKKRNA